jgi:hypothetical protein
VDISEIWKLMGEAVEDRWVSTPRNARVTVVRRGLYQWKGTRELAASEPRPKKNDPPKGEHRGEHGDLMLLLPSRADRI